MLARIGRVRGRAPARKLAPEAVPFQEDLEEIIQEPPPPLLRGPHYAVALLLLSLVALAGFTTVDMVVVGSGRLAADSPPIVLQPMERAIIRQILVKPGDLVKQGQVLALLDPTFAQSDTASLATQRRALVAQRRRLEAELARQPLAAPESANADETLQAILYGQRQSQYAAKLRGFDEDIGAQQAAIRTAEGAVQMLSQQLAVASDVEGLRAKLLEGQVGSRLQYLGARSQRLQAEQDYTTTRNRIAELTHSLQSRQAERAGFVDDWQRQLLEEMVRLRGELARVEEAQAKAARLQELTTLVAPQDGVVLEVARRSAGSVLREAEALITLVPSNVPLIAEIALQSADIGQARAGDPVVVKIDAFPFQRHGALRGVLQSIAPDSTNWQPGSEGAAPAGMPAGGALHRARVVLEGTALQHLPEGARLMPGMTLAAEVKVGARSVLGYFLYPLARGLEESLREP
jgi:hemolysin D